MENGAINKIKISGQVENLFVRARESHAIHTHKWSRFINDQLKLWENLTSECNRRSIFGFLSKQILNDFGKEFFNIIKKSSAKIQTNITKSENAFIIDEFNNVVDYVKIGSNEDLLKLAHTLDYFLHSLNEFKSKKDIEYIIYLRSVPSYIRIDLELNNLIKYPIVKSTNEFRCRIVRVDKQYTLIEARITNIKEQEKEIPYLRQTTFPMKSQERFKYLKEDSPVGA